MFIDTYDGLADTIKFSESSVYFTPDEDAPTPVPNLSLISFYDSGTTPPDLPNLCKLSPTLDALPATVLSLLDGEIYKSHITTALEVVKTRLLCSRLEKPLVYELCRLAAIKSSEGNDQLGDCRPGSALRRIAWEDYLNRK